jgi:hypothetical protein
MLGLIRHWFDLIPTSITQVIAKILHSGKQGRVLFPCLGKNNFFTLFCSELGFDVNTKIVDKEVIFLMDLV